MGLMQSSEGLSRTKRPASLERERSPADPFSLHLQHQLSWVSSLLAQPADFGLSSLHSHMNQFLIIYKGHSH